MRILTWNIAGEDISAQSPSSWNLAKKEDQIVETILREQPDLIALQELTRNDILIQLQTAGYSILPTVDAHIGKVSLLVKFDPRLHVKEVLQVGPSIITILDIENTEHIGFVGCHFPPFKDQVEARQHLLSQIVRELSKRVDHYIICGDMNMREGETTYSTRNLQLDDAFLKAGRPVKFKYTWDGYKNPFHQNNLDSPPGE